MQVSDTSYRGMGLGDDDFKKYAKGLKFVSSSKDINVGVHFALNVLFEISNNTAGADYWRPRDLSHPYLDLHEYLEEKALYPAGAEFEVTGLYKQNISDKSLTVIHLKLLSPA